MPLRQIKPLHVDIPCFQELEQWINNKSDVLFLLKDTFAPFRIFWSVKRSCSHKNSCVATCKQWCEFFKKPFTSRRMQLAHKKEQHGLTKETLLLPLSKFLFRTIGRLKWHKGISLSLKMAGHERCLRPPLVEPMLYPCPFVFSV